MTAETIVRAYYAAFNAGDEAGFLALLSDDVVHDINQGGREIGKPAFG
ncbi:MAG: nuclear transport factor 2 family protein, partial [Acetobacteraceae bacterium]|nr:nuclear transport factor 2 family protein [Acetobacteraceae bacterium]MBV8614866.1 nuclear transport factor 2 family protein [Acetobacteraceae bacterium]